MSGFDGNYNQGETAGRAGSGPPQGSGGPQPQLGPPEPQAGGSAAGTTQSPDSNPEVPPAAPPLPVPELVSAKDALWGENFWEKLESECRGYQRNREEVEMLAKDLESAAGECRKNCLVPMHVTSEEDLWIVGDLHSDLLAFKAIYKFATSKSQQAGHRPRWCFLGDLFDRGIHGHAVLFEVLRLVTAQDQDADFVGFVVGNHDLSLRWDGQVGQFTADVSPCEFADWLNEPGTAEEWRHLARAACEWFANAPRALLLPDYTLVAHGGCVHSDLLAQLDSAKVDDLPEEVLEDLVWLRASENSKRKVPNRFSRGCQFGADDLRDFLDSLGKKLGQRVPRVIRGHDHVLNRWDAPKLYEGRLLTLNAMSWRQIEMLGPFARQPVVARYRPNDFPELFQLAIPEETIRCLYGADQQGAHAPLAEKEMPD